MSSYQEPNQVVALPLGWAFFMWRFELSEGFHFYDFLKSLNLLCTSD